MDLIEIIFLVLDILSVFVIFIMSKVLIAAVKEYNKKSALYSFAGLAFLVANPTLFTVLLIIFVLEFLTICELAFKIHQVKTKPIVKKEKKVSVPYEIYTYEGQTEMPTAQSAKSLSEAKDAEEPSLEEVPAEA